jgi:hypothetical protein
LKSKSLAAAIKRLEDERRAGATFLDVLNRSRPIFHLGYPDDLPDRWRATEPMTLPHIALRRGRVSLTQLRLEGRPVLLTQRSGPSLMLWPLEEDYARPPEMAAVDRLTYVERQLRKLHTRMAEVEAALALMHIATKPRRRSSGRNDTMVEGEDNKKSDNEAVEGNQP